MEFHVQELVRSLNGGLCNYVAETTTGLELTIPCWQTLRLITMMGNHFVEQLDCLPRGGSCFAGDRMAICQTKYVYDVDNPLILGKLLNNRFIRSHIK